MLNVYGGAGATVSAANSFLNDVTAVVLVTEQGEELMRLDPYELVHLVEYEVTAVLPAEGM